MCIRDSEWVVAGGKDTAGAEVALVAGGDHYCDAAAPSCLDGTIHRIAREGAHRVAADRDVEHADVVVVLVRDRPGDAGDHGGRAPLTDLVEHFDADDVGGGGDAAELDGGAAVLARQGGGTVPGNKAGDIG